MLYFQPYLHFLFTICFVRSSRTGSALELSNTIANDPNVAAILATVASASANVTEGLATTKKKSKSKNKLKQLSKLLLSSLNAITKKTPTTSASAGRYLNSKFIVFF